MSGTRTQVSRFPSTSFPSLSLYTTLLLSCSITRIVKYRLHVLCLVSGSLLLVRSDESVDGENKHFPKLQKVWLCDDRPLTVVLGNTTEPRLRLHPGSGTQDGDQTHTGVFWDPNPGSLWNLMLWRILRTSQDFHRSAIAPSLIKAVSSYWMPSTVRTGMEMLLGLEEVGLRNAPGPSVSKRHRLAAAAGRQAESLRSSTDPLGF
ncbi:uncharacterized protein LOC116573025 isoform X2 [Mustela erminea]|uniref:uncharacterized protein LOC116573025 isoform X2 n=1 Tax=Mustela erminea TaxID=36723 RepID=UPI0013869F7F|nr:uncharacterized protein LOC116573025 isoform X2 [Mustela erminea]